MQLVLVVVAAVTLLPLAVALPQTSPISSTTAPVTSSTQASVWPVPAMAAGNATVGGTGNPSTSDQPLIFTGNGTVAAAPEDEGQELKRSYHRGWGSLPKLCDPGWEYQIGLCYPVCPQGFHGAGPVCWEV